MHEQLNTALAYHQRGLLDEAARLYDAVLADDPEQPDALHLLGVVSLQQGRPQQASDLIRRAVARRPNAAPFHANLAEAQRALGHLDQAAASCRTALRYQPNFPEAHNNLGLILLAQGRADDAADAFRAALRHRPDFAMACNNLGNALRTRGDRAGATDHFRRALGMDPNLPEAHSNLGQILLEQHELREALVHLREAVRLRPSFAEARNNLGNALRELGNLPEAKACYAEALRLNPGQAMTYNNMGQALQEESLLDDAFAWYQRALQLDPNSARIHSNLASLFADQEKYDDALARYALALRLDPSYAEAHSGIGWVRHEQGHFEEAEAHYREALRLKPDLAAAHANLGTVREELGDFTEAQKCWRAAVRHDPRHAGARAQLATMLRGKLPEEDLADLKRLLAEPDLTDGRRAALHFGLAQALDARGEFAAAGESLRVANAIALTERAKRGQGYDPSLHAPFVAGLMAVCTPEFFGRVRGFGLETERPIFVVGLPRSGTTLTEQILASHSRVFGAGELRLARDGFEMLAGGTAGADLDARALEGLARLDRETARRVGERHQERLAALNADRARVADKMPDNYLYLGLLAAVFPKAKFVHCRRDLRDVAVSCWMTNFRHIRWANDPEHIATRFAEYRRVMDHWKRVLPVPLLEVDYEETVADLEGVARRLVTFCGLEWETACLAFHEGKRPVRTASVSQVR
ncbi:MAG TPA: tetratricopeptide repeat protein, partial [Gemmataceae bacterium]|nr:tetratricopeptide repeat protein [Gemmataceae bacterium]